MTPRRWAPIAAAVVCSVVFGGVVVFGHVQYPAFEPASAVPPEVAGQIAVVVEDPSDDERCLRVIAPAGGEQRELRCTYRWDELTGWSADGLVIVTLQEDRTRRSLYLDPQTGSVVRRVFEDPALEPTTARSEPGLYTDGPEGVARIVEEDADGNQRVVFSVDGPRSYRFSHAAWSPDRRWILALDSQDRLVVVDPRDGVAWQITEEVEVASWHVDGHRPAARVGW